MKERVMFVSWIKKIFGKLSDNDEQFEEYYDEKQDDVQSTNTKKVERKNIPGPGNSRDVEARMTYQYPKGNFRFPIISDGENRERQRASRKRRTEEKEEPVKKQEMPNRNYNSNNRKSKEENHSASVKPKKTPKVEKGNSRPFTPTEIPSPIYGFKGRPVKKEESVEYELKKFLHNDEDNAHTGVVHQGLSDEEQLIPSEEEVLSMDVTAVERSNESEVEEIKDAPSKTEDETEASIEPPKDQQPLTPDVEAKSTEETTVAEQMEVEGSPRKSSERISLITEIEHAVQEMDDSGQDLEIHEAKGPVENESTQEVVQSVQESQVQDTQSTHQEEPIEEAPLLEESPAEEDREMTIPQQDVKEEEPETTVSQKDIIEEEPPRRKRSHLPFNVLMLKQDKRQMNTSKPPVRAEAVPVAKERVEQEEREMKSESKSAALPVQEEKQETVEEAVSHQPADENQDHQSSVQGEEAAKSYDELSSSTKRTRDYIFPEVDYLMPPVSKEMSEEWLDSQRILLDETLHNFNVRAKVVNVTQGPSVTRFEVQPEPGVKVNKITNLSDDIKLSLAAKDIRMEAPIPGKHTIGIEVPNRESRPVCISEVIASPAFQEPSSPLTAALGLDISGQPIVTDLSKMPHGLIAGATGSGKSVCINSILVSLLYKASPDELKMLLIDPKMVELAPYNRIPHLVSPVITDVKAATAALKWAVEEMERRYELFAHTGVRDIKRFNELAKRNKQYSDMLPYLVIVIDELADLMMMSPADVEEAICRIAQKARACGIHLIIATQRPSVDVITGLIKANVPTRVAFSVSSSVDSRTIIDGSGAERLLGKGDMLFLENGSSKPVRLQGTFVSDDEIDDIINHVREQREPDYLFQQDELIKKAQVTEEEDELFLEACEFVVDQGGASASSLQRRFRIGYNRAARLMEMMESNGIISESRGSKPRDVLISESELETLA